MKKLFSILFFSFALQFSFAEEIVIEGHYQGYNLFVQNPIRENESLTFCIEKVLVNGIEIHHNQSSAFEIPLDSLGFIFGDSIQIVIIHEDDCKPKILNNQNHYQTSTFVIVSIEITTEGTLTWETKNETDKQTYAIEQYRWNKWVIIGEVEGKGSMLSNTYYFDVTPHFGENTIRVQQTDHTGKKRPSDNVTFVSTIEENEITEINQTSRYITLIDQTLYELYDSYGQLVIKGLGKEIDCYNLKPGIYYLNYDNKNEKVVFKKQK